MMDMIELIWILAPWELIVLGIFITALWDVVASHRIKALDEDSKERSFIMSLFYALNEVTIFAASMVMFLIGAAFVVMGAFRGIMYSIQEIILLWS